VIYTMQEKMKRSKGHINKCLGV